MRRDLPYSADIHVCVGVALSAEAREWIGGCRQVNKTAEILYNSLKLAQLSLNLQWCRFYALNVFCTTANYPTRDIHLHIE